jgi:hypothetical protein
MCGHKSSPSASVIEIYGIDGRDRVLHIKRALLAEMFIEELDRNGVHFTGLRQVKIEEEGVTQALPNVEFRLHALTDENCMGLNHRT